MPARFSNDHFRALVPSDYKVLSAYVNSTTKVHVRHITCGHEWYVWPRNLTRGHGCPVCSKQQFGKSQTLTHAEFLLRVNAKFGQSVELLSKYVSMKSRIIVRHKCGRTHDVIADNLLGGQCCPVCNKKKRHELLLGKRLVLVEGFEPEAINWLLSKNVKPKNIITEREGVPRFSYNLKGGIYEYRPDLLVNKHIIVEVKSAMTAGLLGSFYSKPADYLYYAMRAKARSVQATKFTFKLLIMDKSTKTPLKLPKDWTCLSHSQFKRAVRRLNYAE